MYPLPITVATLVFVPAAATADKPPRTRMINIFAKRILVSPFARSLGDYFVPARCRRPALCSHSSGKKSERGTGRECIAHEKVGAVQLGVEKVAIEPQRSVHPPDAHPAWKAG